MESKDTVMGNKSRDKFFKEIGWVNDSICEKFLDDLCEKQAEVSFKAGMKEVVEWVNKHSKIYQGYPYYIEEELDAKVKEWGIE